jgi:hypothetical protein
MQHDLDHPPEDAVLPLDHWDLFRALWPSLCTGDRRALRLCCVAMRGAVDAHAVHVEGQTDSPVLRTATCARLDGVLTLTLRTMACLRGMLGPPGAHFPRLQSLRLLLVGDKDTLLSSCSPDLPCKHRARLIKGAPGRACAWAAARHALRARRGWDAPYHLLPPPPLIPTPFMRPSAGCCRDREPHRLRGHRQRLLPSHPPEPGASS